MSASAAGPGSAVPVAVMPKAGSGPTPAVIESVNVTIDGKAAPVPQGHQPARGVQPGRRQRAVLLLPRRPVVAGGLPPVPGRRQGSAQAGAVVLHAGRRQDGGDHRVAARARRAPADAGVHAAQPPDRLPDLRQGGRVHAAEALLRLGREVRAQRRHQGPQGQGRRHRQAHRARSRALHPVHALHPRLRRGREVARPRDGVPR